jgi:hypothetical protein
MTAVCLVSCLLWDWLSVSPTRLSCSRWSPTSARRQRYFNSLKKEEIETDDAKIENDDAIEDQDIVKSQEKPSKSKDNYAKTELFEKDMAERMNSLEIVV